MAIIFGSLLAFFIFLLLMEIAENWQVNASSEKED
jgi:hypothetical protein